MAREQLQLVRLRAAELDDQALSEISELLGEAKDFDHRRIETLARTGGIAVARRDCGLRPEIVGVALCEGGGRVTSALDHRFAQSKDEVGLRALLMPAASLFRRRDRAPLGLAQMMG